jgi:hypothetical protein
MTFVVFVFRFLEKILRLKHVLHATQLLTIHLDLGACNEKT